MFDNAPCHRKIDDQALNVEKMNVRPGGKQAVMRDTIWNSTVQSMVLPDGTPKGLKLVLEERGVDTKGMVADKNWQNTKTLQSREQWWRKWWD